MTQEPAGCVAARAFTARRMSSTLSTGGEDSGTSASPMPKDGMWLCASWKPGTTVRPCEAHHALRVEVAAQLVPVAHRDDAAAQHGQRRGARPRGIHGQERAALEDPVDAHGVPLALLAACRRNRS